MGMIVRRRVPRGHANWAPGVTGRTLDEPNSPISRNRAE
jgi:hypothetical protein